MTQHRNHCPLSPEDMRAAPLLISAPLDYVPEIDSRTREILTALLQDLDEHRDTLDPEGFPDEWMHALLMRETLEAVLFRTEETHRPPHWLT